MKNKLETNDTNEQKEKYEQRNCEKKVKQQNMVSKSDMPE